MNVSRGTFISLLITGAGIGWLLGLAVSPVVASVITTVLGSAAAVIAGLSGVESQNRIRVDPWPVAILVIGLLIGSITGIQARNQDWLGRDITTDIRRWKAAGLSLSEADIARRLFDNTYPVTGVESAGDSPVVKSGTILFGVGFDECINLRAMQGEALRQELLSSPNQQLRRIPSIIDDTTALEQLVMEVLCAENGSP